MGLATEDVPDAGLRDAFRRGGEMGARMASYDWAASPLGPIAGWSPGLRSAVRMLLASKAQIVVFWGPEHVALYNDAYLPTIGSKHPAALGESARVHWAELWDVLGPLLEGVRETGEAFAGRDHEFAIERHGFLEHVYFDISYDPIRSESGEVEGIYCVVSETTARVLAERRLAALRALSSRLPGLAPAGFADVVVAEAGADVPSARLYLDGARAEIPEGAVAVPLSTGLRSLGTLVAGLNPYLPLDDAYRDFLGSLGEQIGRALADREERTTLEVLDRVGSGIVSRLDLHEIVQLATDAATELTGAAFGAFFYNVVDAAGESYTLYTISGVPREAFSKFPMPRNTAVFGPTFEGIAVVRIDDVTQDPRYGHNPPYHGMPPGHLPVRSYLAVPVVTDAGTVEGGLFLGHAQTGVFTEAAETVATNLARHTAIAMVNARLYEAAQREAEGRRVAFEERDRVARVLQESLLPPELPAVPRLEIAARYQAGVGLVGGDFYDVFALGDGRWGFMLGDVCGRGAEAASVTALARHTARTAAMIEAAPTRVLEHVNTALLRDNSSLFVTALFGHLCPDADGVTVRFCAGGHPPPLIARAGGGVEAVGTAAPLLGIVERVGAPETRIELRTGDVLLLYTDGLIETRRDRELYGPERLERALADAAGRPVEEIADALLSASQAFGAGEAIDDTALLVLRVTAA